MLVSAERTFPRRSRKAAARALVALGLVVSLLSSGQRLAFAAAAGAGPDSAQPDAAADGQRRRELAKAKYEEGVKEYRAEHYADAVRSFLEADAILPSVVLSYNIARAYNKLADDAQTLRWYRNYLRLSPQAENASEVRQYVQSLAEALSKKGIQQLTVLSSPSGATVAVDGNPLGVTPLTVELAPGAHTAQLSLRGFSDASSSFTLPVATPIDVAVTLRLAPKLAQSTRRFGIAPWVTLGVAAACLGGAGAFELARRSAQNSAKNEQVQLAFENDVAAINSRRTTARVLLGVGSALALTGATLLVFNTRVAPESRAVLASVPGGATLSLERRF